MLDTSMALTLIKGATLLEYSSLLIPRGKAGQRMWTSRTATLITCELKGMFQAEKSEALYKQVMFQL